MAFGDYEGNTYINGKRCIDREDCHPFEDAVPVTGIEYDYHCVLGSGDVRLACLKQFLPRIYERTDDKKHYRRVEYSEILGFDPDDFEYGDLSFEYKGIKITMSSGFESKPKRPWYAELVDENGDKWQGYYDYTGWDSPDLRAIYEKAIQKMKRKREDSK